VKPGEVFQLIVFLVALFAVTPLLGGWMAKVFAGERQFLGPVLGWLERWVYRVARVDANEEMTWRTYMWAVLNFNLLGLMALLGLQLGQAWLPLNPQGQANLDFGLAVNNAISFVTNTNWQAYSGENTMSYLTQMLGLGVQNFFSAATGIVVLLALIRGLTRANAANIGNFWADLVRSTVYILLPICLVLALALVSQGVVQTFSAYPTATTLEGAQQVIPLGPAASQIAIKQIGTNGGGFFGQNSAHPFENPTPLSNFLEMLAIILIPAAIVYSYGVMVGNRRQGWSIYAAMTFILLVGLGLALWGEYHANIAMQGLNLMEGKEQRFGVMNSVLWADVTTLTSNGSVNAMHDSLSPLAGGIALFNLLLGECVFGGIGTGLYTMVLFVIITVFLAGLMVGRTPEYLGKKIEAFEVKMAMIAVIAPSACVLIFSAIACGTTTGQSAMGNAGPHGLSEVLYAFASMANNNGSAFGGLTATNPLYLWLGSLAMLIGRFAVIIPVLAIAGSCAAKKKIPASSGTFPTDGPLFVILLIAVVLIVGVLTFFPALSLGPIAEQLLVQAGRTF
jgi:potassium-transporting ATPase potassium-binding subunit